jgi:hypothetical protein
MSSRGTLNSITPFDPADAFAETQQVHGLLEIAVHAGVDHDVFAIAAFEHLENEATPAEDALAVGSQVRLVPLVPPPVDRGLTQHPIHHRDVDLLPAPGDPSGPDGGQRANSCQQSGDVRDAGMTEEYRTGAVTRLLGHEAHASGHQRLPSGAVPPRSVVLSIR